MRTFVPDCTCWSLLLTALAIRLRNKPTYDKIRVLIINKDVRKLLSRKNVNENPIWSWNDSRGKAINNRHFLSSFYYCHIFPHIQHLIIIKSLAVPKIFCIYCLISFHNLLNPFRKIQTVTRMKV